MDSTWNDNQPIYRQLRDKVVAMILEGTLAEGDALPSVRSVAAEHTLNPLTVLKGYQQLVDEGLVEKRRGRGMFVVNGSHDGRDAQRAAELDDLVQVAVGIVGETVQSDDRLQIEQADVLDVLG